MAVRQRLIDQILDHLQLMGPEVERLSGAAAGFVHLNRTDLRAVQMLRSSQGMTAGQLARALQVTSGATTRVIDTLVADGHAIREADPEDRRKVLVKLTPEAARVLDRSLQPLLGAARSLLDGYNDDELETVARFLTDVRSLMRAHAKRLARQLP